MNWEWATFAATVVIQLLVIAVAWGKFETRVAASESAIGTVKAVQEKQWAMLNDHEKRMSVAEAYQQGLQDGTSHMRITRGRASE